MNTRMIFGAALLGLVCSSPALAQVVPGAPGTASPSGVPGATTPINPGTVTPNGSTISPGVPNTTTLPNGGLTPGGAVVPGGAGTTTIPPGAMVPGTLNDGYPAGTDPASRTRPARARRGTTTTTPGTTRP